MMISRVPRARIRVPLTQLHRVHEFALCELLAQRRELATSDPDWSGIETKRVMPERPGRLILLSADLPLSALEAQITIEERLLAAPRWMAVTAKLSQAWSSTLGAPARAIRARLLRRQDGSDMLNLNDSLCTMLAAQLESLADSPTGWPGPDSAWTTVPVWQATLRSTAGDLRRYLGTREADAALGSWADLSRDPAVDPAELAGALGLLERIDRQNNEVAKRALHWVADNLDHLWD